jgi:hypothetical protein
LKFNSISILWSGVGVELEWSWSGVGVELEWSWSGVSVDSMGMELRLRTLICSPLKIIEQNVF